MNSLAHFVISFTSHIISLYFWLLELFTSKDRSLIGESDVRRHLRWWLTLDSVASHNNLAFLQRETEGLLREMAWNKTITKGPQYYFTSSKKVKRDGHKELNLFVCRCEVFKECGHPKNTFLQKFKKSEGLPLHVFVSWDEPWPRGYRDSRENDKLGGKMKHLIKHLRTRVNYSDSELPGCPKTSQRGVAATQNNQEHRTVHASPGLLPVGKCGFETTGP